MNHPTPEQWTSFFYGELPAEENTQLQAHLDRCLDCRACTDQWRGAMNALDTWKLPDVAPRPQRPRIPWAAAAAVLLALGFGLGSLLSSGRQIARAEAQFDTRFAQLRAEMRAELLSEQTALMDRAAAASQTAAQSELEWFGAQWRSEIEAARAEEVNALIAALAQLDASHLNHYASLRRDLERVARHTQDGLLQAQQQLIEIANLAEPASFVEP
jgi:hypothetical protein